MYIYSAISSNGDLIIESFPHSPGSFEIRFLYVIKSNGRALFYDEENNEFTYQINITTSKLWKYESRLIKINLVGDEEKDYYICLSCGNRAIDIIDIYNKTINSLPQEEIFGLLYPSKDFNALELTNEDKTYLFYSIEGKLNRSSHYLYDCLSLLKFQFYDLDLSQNQNYKKLNSTTFEDNENIIIETIKCIEISKYNLIQCFYVYYLNFLVL